MKKNFLIAALAVLLFVAGCTRQQAGFTSDGNGGNKMAGYESITMEKAKEIFRTEGDYIILDVRRADEFAEGHIPGAVNVPNEEIVSAPPAELPDKNKTIYVYCRSGRRSREAASKLVEMGYTDIVDCGGILDWTGEIDSQHRNENTGAAGVEVFEGQLFMTEEELSPFLVEEKDILNEVKRKGK